ncbi:MULTISPECIES: hypothetical protein [unclassified Mesorhizobium]|uniref:glycoside hydrolase family 19 protein n=1 Tax=unclassified Mesorhizobium TaxID=325217 RepID=UPI0018CA16C7|nr:hypothetical protein [Mesorhizobium sp. L2C067A000]
MGAPPLRQCLCHETRRHTNSTRCFKRGYRQRDKLHNAENSKMLGSHLQRELFGDHSEINKLELFGEAAMAAISGTGWELLISRQVEHTRGTRRRTVGTYKVFHNGTAVTGLSGFVCESRGPGDNSKEDNGRRIEPGTYPLATQAGGKYVTIGYTGGKTPPKPGLELLKTNKRTEILIHPGVNFLSSVGCINPTKKVSGPLSDMDFTESRTRVIALIDDLKTFAGGGFPKSNGKRIPNASVVVEGEPVLSTESVESVLEAVAGDPNKGLPAAVFQKFAPRPASGSKRTIYDGYIGAFTSDKGLKTLGDHGVCNNYDRLMHFFAQAAMETGGFTLIRESLTYTTVAAIRNAWRSRAAGKTDQWIKDNLLRKPQALGDWAYGGRMGNVKGTLDGFNFRGGGTFQTTGRDAYTAKGKLAKVDLANHPELIEDPQTSLLAACAEWKGSGCNAFADAGLIKKISRAINVGNANSATQANGEADRIAWHEKIFKAVKNAGLLG